MSSASSRRRAGGRSSSPTPAADTYGEPRAVWTPRRLVLYLFGLVLLTAAYAVYNQLLGRYDGLPPLPGQFLDRRTADDADIGTGFVVPGNPPGATLPNAPDGAGEVEPAMSPPIAPPPGAPCARSESTRTTRSSSTTSQPSSGTSTSATWHSSTRRERWRFSLATARHGSSSKR